MDNATFQRSTGAQGRCNPLAPIAIAPSSSVDALQLYGSRLGEALCQGP